MLLANFGKDFNNYVLIKFAAIKVVLLISFVAPNQFQKNVKQFSRINYSVL